MIKEIDMKMKGISLTTILVLLLAGWLPTHAQVNGKVIHADDPTPLAGAHVTLVSAAQTVVTDAAGNFIFESVPEGRDMLRVQFVGFATQTMRISDNSRDLVIGLEPAPVNSDAVVITGTRTRKSVGSVPGRTEWMNRAMLRSLPALQMDEYLAAMPGLQVSRDHGLLSHSSTVSMRGLGGDQQGRYLVLLNGAPMNKADGGSVNWNSINPLSVRQVEVAKGPMSSLYGGHAMGGAINLIERMPHDKLEGEVMAEYGTMNTLKTAAWLGGQLNEDGTGLYWAIDGFLNKSDGYIFTPEEERDSTVIASWMNEWKGKARVGYRINTRHTIELSSGYWDDKRGSGNRIFSESGTYFGHKVWRSDLNYRMQYDQLHLQVNLFNSDENYIRLNESIRGTIGDYTYTAYDVTSTRTDRGGHLHGDYRLGIQTLSAGMELKQGSVYGLDIYNTSTDIVTNKGKMNTLAGYIQDDISLVKEKLNVVVGLRFDQARFFDGGFTLTDPTSATSILADLENPELDEYTWSAVSPKAAIKYRFNSRTNLYLSYGYGFRPSVLDDLCRSGFVRGGFKKANPNLDPEKVNNYEGGFDLGLGDGFKLTGSGYYTRGKDFIYLVSTGEFIRMGTRERPVKEARNISDVETYGAEMAAWYQTQIGIQAWVSYAWNQSQILDFDDPDNTDLIGKALIYNPEHMIKSGLSWINPWVNLTLQANWTSAQWMDDLNEESIPAHLKIHARIWKQFGQAEVFVSGNNLTDVVYLEGHGQLSLGRFLSGGVKFAL